MATITDPEVTSFGDTYARNAATILRDLVGRANEMIAEYFLSISGNTEFVSASNDDVIGDQSSDSQPYTKADLINVITRLQQVVDGAAGFESAGGLNGANMMDAPLKLVVLKFGSRQE